MDPVIALVVPQVNVNDDTVLLVRWSVAQYGQVAAGDTVCEVETSKASAEVTANRGGVLVQSAAAPVRVRIGETIGAIGPTRESAAAYLAAASPAALADARVNATAKAMALAASHGVSLDAVAQAGVRGTIKESDVRKFLEASSASQAATGPAPLPPGLATYLESEGALPAFDAAVAASLRRSTDHVILTSVDADCRLTAAHVVIDRMLAAGSMVSVLHLLIAAAGRALPQFPRLMSFLHEGTVYRYRSVDIAFVARTPDGRLYTIADDGRLRRYGPGPSFFKEKSVTIRGGREPLTIAVDRPGNLAAIGFAASRKIAIYDTRSLALRQLIGVPGKPQDGFPPLPPPLEIATRFPHSHRLDGEINIVL